ncbi:MULTISPECIES: DUF1722 domain-containing protein [Brevibacillus]|uniref:DUF1722 domain-containing protein n=1 Tax=Brevibacillus TaxID=55080 RepID=UPI0002404B34|nr:MULTISPECIES: DUF1722 domain-containing protein [Brevibacillus]AUM66799.1 DUF1722 domain-containing protein [Brevibacillus laterosporus]AYK05665.1 DUF1722 domain-containing protein [Brevibacillus laterosporus]ERM17873.1 hypothetical protein P615_01920 [Brevibacillus laterosporus PE36]MBA4532592.1 DUF1722 domain-containing protein [Brevibacillus halotolerans]MCR8964276.1 YbgA family protein [Brevibacillus laterosporus]
MNMTCQNDLFSSEKRFSFSLVSKAWCEQIWAEHKYWVMMRCYQKYKQISQAFRDQVKTSRETGERDWSIFAEQLLHEFQKMRKLPIDSGNACNALSHAFGHLRGKLTEQESGSWHVLLQRNWEEAHRILFLLTMEYGDDYLSRSRLFSPEAPSSHTWIRFRGKDFFIAKDLGQWKILEPWEVWERVGVYQVNLLTKYRLLANLGGIVHPLAHYDQYINRD